MLILHCVSDSPQPLCRTWQNRKWCDCLAVTGSFDTFGGGNVCISRG